MSEEKKNPRICGCKCEVWARVCGYYRPVRSFNKGKQEEYRERLNYKFRPESLDLAAKIERGEKIDLDSVELAVVQEAEKARRLRGMGAELVRKEKEMEAGIKEEPLIYSI